MFTKQRYFFGNWRPADREFTLSDVEELLREGRRQEKAFQNYPTEKVLGVFKKLQALWSDPHFPLRKQLAEELPRKTGFSYPMIQMALEELAHLLSPEALEKKLKTELRGISKESWTYDFETETKLRWQPLGTVLHILSGNVFLVGVGSLIEGLITGNLTILKRPSNDTGFLDLFIQTLIDADSDGVLSKSIALIDYSSSNQVVISALKTQVDGLVVWGGEEAVKSYRQDLPAHTRLIVFGPKLSLAFVSKKGLEERGVAQTSDKLAFELSLWDQNACTAPQVCLVEGKELAKEFALQLNRSLEKQNRTLPPGPVDTNTAVEIQKERSRYEMAEFRGECLQLGSKGNLDWTVILDSHFSIEPSPLHRFIRVLAFKDFSEVERELEKLRGYVQTLGVAVAATESVALEKKFYQAGVLRILDLGEMSGGEIDDPHDGSYDLSLYGNFFYSRIKEASRLQNPLDFLSSKDMQARIDSRLRRLIQEARKSSYYGPLLEGKKIETTNDLAQLPVLSRALMEQNSPPESRGLTTRELRGGYITRSGGSTGAPTYSVYDGMDWDHLVKEAVGVFRAMGITPKDRIANCMLSGDLYGSFVSFDHINSALGAMSFALAGKATPENLLEIWEKFRVNSIQGMPTTLVPLLRQTKKLQGDFHLEKMIFAGGPLAPSDRQWLKENLGMRIIASVIGANDGGQMAYQCPFLQLKEHHLVDDYNFVEILDDKNEPVPQGTAGKIVITSLMKWAVPLIRYEIGDQGRILDKVCECGRQTRILEYLGRSDDILCIGLLNLCYSDVQSALSDLPISILQLVGKNSPEGESVLVRVEAEDLSLAEKIYAQILKRIPSIQEYLDEGHLVRLDVEVSSPGSLPRNPRTGKVKQWIDERS